jgi:UDP-N-acetylglucosamine enolpyruvyl transferase
MRGRQSAVLLVKLACSCRGRRPRRPRHLRNIGGYELLEEKLSACGADIERISE